MAQTLKSDNTATEAEIAAARRLFAGGNVKIQDAAAASRCDHGDVWVQAWLLVPSGEARTGQGAYACAVQQAGLASVTVAVAGAARAIPSLAVGKDRAHASEEFTVFEVTAFGFDGAADETDDRVYWVAAQDSKCVCDALEGTAANFAGTTLASSDDPDVDYVLPDQVDELRIALMGWNTEAHEKLTHDWQRKHGEAAAREGWSMFDADGSDNGRWQLCRIDDAEEWSLSQGYPVPQLSCDGDAWIIVRRGVGEHHRSALELLAIVNTAEVKAIADFLAGQTASARARP